MGQVKGYSTVLVMGEESTYGTAASGNFLKILHAGETLTASRNLIDSATIQTGRVRSAPITGNWDVNGQITTEINCESMLYLLKHATTNTPTKAGASAPFTFTYEPDDALPVGMTLELDYGSDISGSGRVVQFVGCRVAGFDMNFPSEGIPTAIWRIVGAKPNQLSALTDSGAATIGTHQPFSAFQCSITEEGSAYAKATSISFSVDNGVESVFAIGGAGSRISAPEGFVTVTGQLEAIFDSVTVLNKAIAGTESKLEITLSRGTGLGATVGNESIVFTLEELLYEPSFPVVEGPAGLLVRLPFKGYMKSTAYAFKAVAKIPNDVSTIPAS